MRYSSLIFQLPASPFTKPEIITKSRTKMLIAVKILFTHADSFTPKDKRPIKEKYFIDVNDPLN